MNEQRVLNLVKKLVQFNTINPPGNERELVIFLAEFSETHGLETYIVDSAENRSNLLIYLRGRNKEAKKLYFSGHLDTVPIGEEKWDFDPFTGHLENGRIYGRGSCDMKGGVAALIETMISIQESGLILENDIVFIGTVGEEVDCLGAKTLVEKNLIENPGAIVIAEPTSLEVFTGHKGVIWLEINTYGKTAHGSMPEQGVNAITNMLRILEALSHLKIDFKDDLLGSTTLSTNIIKGGVATNVIPDKCTVAIDIRTVTTDSNELILKKIKDLINRLQSEDSSFEASINVLQNLGPLLNDKGDNFIEFSQNLNNKLNSKLIRDVGVNYYTDASIFRKHFDCPIIIYGAGDEKLAHQPNEYIEINKLYKSIIFYTKLAEKFDEKYLILGGKLNERIK